MKARRPLRQYLWVASSIYIALGFVNILAAWLGLICFAAPLAVALVNRDKGYCNLYCGRGQLFSLLGGRMRLSRQRETPRWLRSAAFRYGFLTFFLLMFANMAWATWLVFAGAGSLRQAVTLFWTIRLPWQWAHTATVVPPWVAQFAFGFYSLMLTSTLLGLIAMALYRPRSWCAFCPMGTMTQLLCRARNPELRAEPTTGAMPG
ncbi:MAG: 4Fe-4S binding protein [Clostridiales bacterium]|nr:4Fe-4S binding protein [Clostridiales bacterium]